MENRTTDNQPRPEPTVADEASGDQMSIRQRWLAALCYLSVLVFVPILSAGKTEFLKQHCRQGFALFFCEVVGVAFILIMDSSLGRVPVLGFLLVIVIRLVFFLLFLSLSVLGFTKAIFGETWRVPYLDELAERVPIE